MSGDIFQVPLKNNNGDPIATIDLYPEQDGMGPYVISQEEADQHAEARIQICEGATYEYRLAPAKFALKEQAGIIRRSKAFQSHNQGRITPGLNIGRLRLEAESTGDFRESASIDIEVRPTKVGYRNDYRQMLELITERCTDLILEFRSPVEQTLLFNSSGNPETICQRFAFVKSLVTSKKFRDAVHRIIALPHRLRHQEVASDVHRRGREGVRGGAHRED